MENQIKSIIKKYGNDKSRLMDILLDIQEKNRCVSPEAVDIVAKELKMTTAEVKQTLSFYHFFSCQSVGNVAIYLNNSVVANMMGGREVAKAFEEAAGCSFNSVTTDGSIGLWDTACIGMSDQEPAALINGIVFTRLTPEKAKSIIADIKAGKKVEEIAGKEPLGDGMNASAEVKSMVQNNIRKTGIILDPAYIPGTTVSQKLVQMTPEQVIAEVKASNVRGRGGAGFPTGIKWEFCRKSKGDKKYIICNADEGEPGTFKDRVLLTEKAAMVFEGMIIAGYAIGASEGILYLRYEYKYLRDHLEKVLSDLRKKNLLGKNIAGIKDFNFDIRIQSGAGAYVCGEESALIESAEGKRGEPRDRPPFPVEKGYMQKPTSVNNVETYCAVVKIVFSSAEAFKKLGTKDSSGTKVLSISGDCKYPGIYEIKWGMTIADMLRMVGADDVQAVQVAGPSGVLIGPGEFNRTIDFADLATGGSMIVFNNKRNLLHDVVLNFTEFFIEESCGSCSTCRITPVILKNTLEKIIAGKGVQADLDNINKWAPLVKVSRCGLGQTAANPIFTSLKNFRKLYEEKLQKDKDYDMGFDLNAAIQDSCKVVGRKAVIHE